MNTVYHPDPEINAGMILDVNPTQSKPPTRAIEREKAASS